MDKEGVSNMFHQKETWVQTQELLSRLYVTREEGTRTSLTVQEIGDFGARETVPDKEDEGDGPEVDDEADVKDENDG